VCYDRQVNVQAREGGQGAPLHFITPTVVVTVKTLLHTHKFTVVFTMNTFHTQ